MLSSIVGASVRCVIRILFVSMLMIRFCVAQTSSTSGAEGIDPGRIPVDALVFTSIQPNTIFNLQAFDLYPREVAKAAGIEYAGFDPLMIERIDMAVGLNPLTGPTIGFMISTLSPVRIQELKNLPFSKESQKDASGLVFYPSTDPEFLKFNVVLAELDERHFLVGSQSYVQRMAKIQEPTGRIAMLAASMKVSDELITIIDLAAVRPMIDVQLEQAQKDILPPFRAPLSKLIDATDFVAFCWGKRDSYALKTILMGKDDADGKSVEESLTAMKDIGLAMIREQIQGELNRFANTEAVPDSIRNALQQYMERMFGEADHTVMLNRQGRSVLLTYDSKYTSQLGSIQVVGVMSGLLLPAIQQARMAARRASSSNKLRQLVLALLNYESAYKKLPSSAILDSNTKKPLLSWRVAILPFVDEADLYKEFHLNEPWDSPHNIKLLERMPSTFKSPSVMMPVGYTNYLSVSGKDFAFSPEVENKFSGITDGLSNTIALVEVGKENAVPWTAPMDLTPVKEDPLRGLIPSANPTGFNVAMMDGAIQFLTNDIAPNTLWSLFTRAGNDDLNQ